jgi:hypothetical protein
MSVLRNACGNIVFIFNDCQAGLSAPDSPKVPFFAVLMGYATSITELVQPYAPGSA